MLEELSRHCFLAMQKCVGAHGQGCLAQDLGFDISNWVVFIAGAQKPDNLCENPAESMSSVFPAECDGGQDVV